MREVGASELEGTGVRAAPLEGDHGDDLARESEPDNCRQQPKDAEQAEQEDRGSQGDRSEQRGFRQLPPWNPISGDDSRRERERQARGHRRYRQCKRQPHDPGRLGQDQARRGGSDAQSKGAPETAPVEPDRLGDQLADRSRLRR